MSGNGTLILFAKYPTPGKVKTRLIPAVNAETAALLAESFLLDLTERIARNLNPHIRCVLCFDPPDAKAAFCELLANVPAFAERFDFVAQRGEGLGQRLTNALADVRQTHSGPFIFIGADAPDLPLHEIESGAHHAQNRTAYLTPAHDGGYVLLALPHDVLDTVFDNIAWSTVTTANDQIVQLKRCGITTVSLGQTWRDVDDPDDLKYLEDRLNADSSIAIRTHIVFKACV